MEDLDQRVDVECVYPPESQERLLRRVCEGTAFLVVLIPEMKARGCCNGLDATAPRFRRVLVILIVILIIRRLFKSCLDPDYFPAKVAPELITHVPGCRFLGGLFMY